MITTLQLPPPLPSRPSSSPLTLNPCKTSQQPSGLLVRQKLLHLQTLNVNPNKALNQNPDFRSTPLSSLLSLESYFLSLGLSGPALGRILDMHPKLLTSDIHSDLQPIIHFLLHEVLIPSTDLPKSITRCPSLLVTDVSTQLRPAFKFLNEIGFVSSNRINCRTTSLLVFSVERKLKPKIEYLKSLGFSDKEVEKMVIRSPAMLTYSVENNLVPKVEFFVEEMKGDLEEIKRFPQYFCSSLEKKIKPRYRVLVEHGFKLPLFKMLRVSDREFNTTVKLSLFQLHQNKMITRLQLSPPLPSLPSSSPLTLNPCKTSQQQPSGLHFRQKLLHLQTLNVNPYKALNQNPDFRSTPLSSLLSLESYFLSLGLSGPALGRILDMHPKLLTSDIHSDLQPIIHFLLYEVLIPSTDLPKSITRCPRLLVTDVSTQLRPTFKFLNEIGFVGRYRINCRTTKILVFSVERRLKPKIEYLKSLGFSDKEVEKMVIRSPALLTCSVENNLVPKVEFFVEEIKGDLEEIKRFPNYFCSSLEKKIKPRYRALVEYGFKLPLSEMLVASDEDFNNRLIEMRLHLAERMSKIL